MSMITAPAPQLGVTRLRAPDAGDALRLPRFQAGSAWQATALDLAPHVARRVDDEAKLRLLRLHRDLVAVDGAREAALRRQAHLRERRELRGLVDAALQVVLAFQRSHFGAHQTQDDGLAL